MRKNQVEIKISRFGEEVPRLYDNDRQIIKVYADSNNLFEALSIAYSEAIQQLKVYEVIPLSGRVDVTNNNEDEWL